MELHTGALANAFGKDRTTGIERLRGRRSGRQVSASGHVYHGINYHVLLSIKSASRGVEYRTFDYRSRSAGIGVAVREMLAMKATRMSIIGIIDLVDCIRIEHSIERFGDRFLKRRFYRR